MPLYEYTCKSCGDDSEYLVGVGSDQPDLVCAHCGSSEIRRKISIVSVATGASLDSCCGGCEGGACDGEFAGCGTGGACACGH